MRVTVRQLESAPRGWWEQNAPNRLPHDVAVYWGQVAYTVEYARDKPNDPGYCWVKCNGSNICYFPDYRQLESEVQLSVSNLWYNGRLREIPYDVRRALHDHLKSQKYGP